MPAMIIPEVVLFFVTIIALLTGALMRSENRHYVVYLIVQAGLLITAGIIFSLYPQQVDIGFYSSVVFDPFSAILKILICLFTLVVFVYAREYLKYQNWMKDEYFILGLFSVIGMMVLVSAYNLLTVYIGLELMSLSLYTMVAMYRDSKAASEAGMKYFILGALASGILLYGMSLLYGLSGSLNLLEINAAIQHSDTDNAKLWLFALVFIIVGIGFKLGAVPFHMWVPDVYQGAPTAVTLFISSIPKLAVFAMAIRLLVDGLSYLAVDWQMMLVVLSVLSMAVGNIVAMSQSNIKRMLAYSAIAHAGFLLLGLLSKSNYSGAMFYSIVYVLMSMAAFGMVSVLSAKGPESEHLENYKGLFRRDKWLAFIMLCIMFSMAGIPPFAGFWAKWFVLKEVFEAGFVWLAVLAVLFSVIGVYYYLRIVKLMYFDAPPSDTLVHPSFSMRFLLTVNGLSLLYIGLFPEALMDICLFAFYI